MALMVLLVMAVLMGPATSPEVPRQAVTVSGCLEQDAAARTASYKLVVKKEGGTDIYRLTAPPTVDLAAELGRVVEIAGNVTKVNRVGREELELAVRTMKRVADKCD